MDFVALDFETANEKWASACEIGLSKVEGGRLIETKSWLIKPVGDFRYWNTKIHGINAEKVKHEPHFGELWAEIAEWMDGQVVIAHNAQFDLGVLRAALDHYHLPYPHLSYLCSIKIARETWHGLPAYGLATLSQVHDIELDHHHAGNDAEACARIVMKAGRYHLAAHMDDLVEATQLKYGRIFPGGYVPCSSQKEQASKKRPGARKWVRNF